MEERDRPPRKKSKLGRSASNASARSVLESMSSPNDGGRTTMTKDRAALAPPARVSLDSSTPTSAIDLTDESPSSSSSPPPTIDGRVALAVEASPAASGVGADADALVSVATTVHHRPPMPNIIQPTTEATKGRAKKKRSFHDEILYSMLTYCGPYTLKTLASRTNTTIEALNHAMLSFLDKGLVICKEFPCKQGGSGGSGREPRRLYWAYPATLSEIDASAADGHGGRGGKGGGGGGGGAVIRELSKLLSTSGEMDERNAERRGLEDRYRAIMDELNPLLSIPTMAQLNDELSEAEGELRRVRAEIEAVKERTRSAATARSANAAPHAASGRRPLGRANGTPRRDPTTLKRMINHMLGEYKTRKRKCMDFVEELSEAMERKTADIVGDKVLCLDTDETEWGLWEDGTTGKVYGTKRKQSGGGGGGKLGRMNDGDDGEAQVVKIPARYKDV
ncbi:hypothetical protein ACHAXA_011655 [Cyclostephanos tholiformis]|uniref:Uncharacterized protein n=1 Tax=Cyclostephanos tholiformis TaxID=382380 RepID=A0ABD3SEY9_9STRA